MKNRVAEIRGLNNRLLSPKARSKYSETLWLAFFLGPSLGGFLLFYFFPFFEGVYYSLTDSVLGGSFVGLSNYRSLLESRSFTLAVANTARFTALCVPLNMVLSLAAALLLNRSLHFRDFFRTSMIAPLVVPVASVAVFWRIVFQSGGLLGSADWLNSELSLFAVLIVYLWKNTGYCMVLFLAGLQNIPSVYYESAAMDGAGRWTQFRHITLVFLTPTTFFAGVISVLNSFKVFREAYLMAGDYPHRSMYMLQHYMNNMFRTLDYQKLTSAACLIFLFVYLVVLLFFRVERRISGTLH